MKDHPILFSEPMVRALLDGRKTQTRRVIMPQPVNPIDSIFTDGKVWWTGDCLTGEKDEALRVRYAVGDHLWVREAWRTVVGVDDQPPRDLIPHLFPVSYEADGKPLNGRLRASMFMPRWASRISLLVTDVRVQRLHDISEADAIAEGLTGLTKDGKLIKYGIPDRDGLPGNDDLGWHWSEWNADPRKAYATIWDRINGDGEWGLNHWVAAYTFTVAKANIDNSGEAA